MEVGSFRKKPVVIEAFRFEGEDRMDWPEPWASAPELHCILHATKPMNVGVACETLEGSITARVGDWIIIGVKGEYYPCKPDIFAATYEPSNTRAQRKASAVSEPVNPIPAPTERGVKP